MRTFNKFKVEIGDIEWIDPEVSLPKVNNKLDRSENLLLVQHYRNCLCVTEGWYDKDFENFMDICGDEIITDVCAWAYKPKVKRI